MSAGSRYRGCAWIFSSRGAPPGAGSDGSGTVTRTLLQNMEILSAGQNYQKDAEGKPVLVQVVNLLVTPEQAEVLNLATDQKIQLVLRNPADHDIVNTPGAASANLFDGGARVLRPSASPVRPAQARMPAPVQAVKPLPEPALPPRIVTIEVFSGNKRTESIVKNPDSLAPQVIPQ